MTGTLKMFILYLSQGTLFNCFTLFLNESVNNMFSQDINQRLVYKTSDYFIRIICNFLEFFNSHYLLKNFQTEKT